MSNARQMQVKHGLQAVEALRHRIDERAITDGSGGSPGHEVGATTLTVHRGSRESAECRHREGGSPTSSAGTIDRAFSTLRELSRRPTVKTSAQILDLYGAFIRRLGGWIATASPFAAAYGSRDPWPTARGAVARLSRSGVLRRSEYGASSVMGFELSVEPQVSQG
jgi:hypothetical protein